MAGDFAELERGTELVDRIAAKLAAADGLDWNEQCAGEQPDGDGLCESSTCVAAHYEDHDPNIARASYRRYARVALAAVGQQVSAESKLAASHAADPDILPDGTKESLATCARMLAEWGPELFPVDDNGQVHFARAMMDSTAAEIGAFLASKSDVVPVQREVLTQAHEVIRDEWLVALSSYCVTDAGGWPDLSTLSDEDRPYVMRLQETKDALLAALDAAAPADAAETP